MAGEFAKFFIEFGTKFNPKGLKQAQTSIDKTKKKAGDLGGTLKKLGGVLAGGLIARQMMQFAKASFEAFAKQEKAINNLNSALKNLNIFTVELSESLQQEARDIQKITTVGDETTLAVMQLGLSMGVTSDKITEATKQTIGLSKAYGVDLNASMKMVALAQQGEFTMLNRYIPQLRSLETNTEKAAMTTKLLAAGFNLAQAETKTAEGRLIQMQNAMGDLQERIGNELIPVFNTWVGWINKAIDGMDKLFRSEEKSTAGLSRYAKELISVNTELKIRSKNLQALRSNERDDTAQYKEEANQYKILTDRKIALDKLVAEEKAKAQKESIKITIKNGNEEVESSEDIAKKKKAIDDWYLSDKGIAETNFYQWLHESQIEWDALTLEQKEETMKKIQETTEKANTSMVTGFAFAVNSIKAKGMQWAVAWDGMISSTTSGMASAIKVFITSSGSMFDNFRTLLDGIFKSILDSFISMVSQMIAKWAILNILTGGKTSFGVGLLGAFEKGGPVNQTGPYILHKGEEVITADIANAVRSGKSSIPSAMSNKTNNSFGGTVLNQTVNIAGTSETNIDIIARKLTKATRDGLPSATDFAKTSFKVGKNRENETVI